MARMGGRGTSNYADRVRDRVRVLMNQQGNGKCMRHHGAGEGEVHEVRFELIVGSSLRHLTVRVRVSVRIKVRISVRIRVRIRVSAKLIVDHNLRRRLN